MSRVHCPSSLAPVTQRFAFGDAINWPLAYRKFRATSRPKHRDIPRLWIELQTEQYTAGAPGAQSLSHVCQSTDSGTAVVGYTSKPSAHAERVRERESERREERETYTQTHTHTDPAALAYGVIMNSLARSVNVLKVTIAHKSIYYFCRMLCTHLLLSLGYWSSMVTKWSRTRWLTDKNF